MATETMTVRTPNWEVKEVWADDKSPRGTKRVWAETAEEAARKAHEDGIEIVSVKKL